MDIDTLKKALKEDIALFAEGNVEIIEIGDGNINRVFRATIDNGDAYVIKYAPAQANISSSISLNPSRGKIESEYLKEVGRLMTAYVPAVVDYSEKSHCIIMQDLSAQYKVLQRELAAGNVYDFLAPQLAEYVATTGYAFSDFSLSSAKKAAMRKRFSNPKLCALTERLVFTEPYENCSNNSFSDVNRAFITQEIYLNPKITDSAKRLKKVFMGCPQSLIHGDLHFGSVFVGEKDIKVFDPEFCFFGPIGYDLGVLFAHFLLHYSYQAVTKKEKAESICAWLKQQAVCLLTTFESRFLKQAGCDAGTSKERERVIRTFLDDVFRTTAGFAGTECVRRIIGLAKVSAFVFGEESEKAQYELHALSLGRYLLEHFETFTSSRVFAEKLNFLLR